MLRILCIVVAISITGCAVQPAEDISLGRPSADALVTDVSIYSLVANPQIYDGRRVRTTGMLRVEYEGTALYVNAESLMNRVEVNALWLHFNPSALADELGVDVARLQQLNGYIATVEGVFEGTLPEPRCHEDQKPAHDCIAIGTPSAGHLTNVVHIKGRPYEGAP